MPSKRPYIQWFSTWPIGAEKSRQLIMTKVTNKVGQQFVVQKFYFIHLCSESNVLKEKICLQSDHTFNGLAAGL
jgi:hypothetical protein